MTGQASGCFGIGSFFPPSHYQGDDGAKVRSGESRSMMACPRSSCRASLSFLEHVAVRQRGRQLGHTARWSWARNETRNSEPRSERGQIVECDEVYRWRGGGKKPVFFTLFSNSGIFPSHWAGSIACSLAALESRDSEQKSSCSRYGSCVDTDVPLHMQKRPRTGSGGGEMRALWLCV